MSYNFPAKSFHTKELYSRLSSKEIHFYTEDGHFAFLSPLWGLEATYAVRLRLNGKHFLSVIIELFSLGATAWTLRANIDWKSPFLKGWINLAQNFR